jgi:crotonobetainyl-CoA:carnitine CoA-transferase CaiB-like acyl-CoA transferase
MAVIDGANLIEEERFADGHSRFENRGGLIDSRDNEFASRTDDQWREILEPMAGGSVL